MAIKIRRDRPLIERDLEHALMLSDALCDYSDALTNGNKTWTRECWNRLRKRFGLTPAEIRIFLAEDFERYARIHC